MLSKWNVNIMCFDSNSQRYSVDRHWGHRVVIGSDGIGSYTMKRATIQACQLPETIFKPHEN
jgi:hypothetical protein